MDSYMRKESHKTMKTCINSIRTNVFIMIIMIHAWKIKVRISNLDKKRNRYTKRRDCFCEWNDICKQFILPGLMWHKLTIAMQFNRKDENYNNKNMCVTFDMGRRQWKSTLSEWRVMFIVCLKQGTAKSISLACRPNRMPEAETQPSYQDLLFYPYGYGAFFLHSCRFRILFNTTFSRPF